MPQDFYSKLETLLKTDPRFLSQELEQKGELLKNNVIDCAYKADKKLVELLLSDSEVKNKFFSKIKDALVFNINDFIAYIQDKKFLADSYTKYRNKIGLTIDGKFLNERREVALVWPFKDCVLEGGMTKDDEKRKEIFFNEILAQDEIDKLLAPKVLTNWKRYTPKGTEKVKELKRDENGVIRENMIIKGNNLLALHSLKQQFQNKVKLIYIDPPYNTGNDSFGYNDSFNHSTWLTFMKSRLEVARELLRDDGLFFLQIDNNEHAYLKILCDEVFGRENFRNNIIWKKLTSAKSQSNYLANVTEHILFYSKNNNPGFYEKFLTSDEVKDKKNYPCIEETTGRRYGSFDFTQSGQGVARIFNNKKLSPPKGKHWIWNQEKIYGGIKKGIIIFTKNGTPRLKRYLDEKQGNYLSDLWNDNEVAPISANDKERLSEFEGQKKEAVLKRIIEISTKEKDIVLDFFAGSGTSGATAMKMKRQFILCEQMDYIEKVTVERLKKVIAGEQGGISKAVDWKGGGDFVYCELMEHNEQFVEKIKKVGNTKELLKIWKEIQAKGFINYMVKPEEFDKNITEFKNLPFAKQQRVLFDMLNKNQLYVNKSEIGDKDFGVGSDERKINKEFYGK